MNQAKPTEQQKTLSRALDRLSARLLACYVTPNDGEHKFERTGWLLVRAGMLMIDAGDKAHALASDWAARGYPAGSDEPKVSGGGDISKLNSVEAASQHSDEWEIRATQLALMRRLLDDNAKQMESDIAHTVKVLANEGRRSSLVPCGNPRTNATGDLVCKNEVTGIGEDRLRDGRCPRCYAFRYRTGLEWNPRIDDAEKVG